MGIDCGVEGVMLEMVTLIAVVLLISKDQMMLVEVMIPQDPLFFCVADAQKTLLFVLPTPLRCTQSPKHLTS